MYVKTVNPDPGLFMSSESLICLDRISMVFHGREVLSNISLTVDTGKIVTLVGPNGAGKTTLVRIILGLQQSSSGYRRLKKNLQIGYMPQKLQVNPSMPLTVNRFLHLTGSSQPAVIAALEKTGIPHVAKQPVQSLSGGELQRTLLARALLQQPDLLVLDEPVQGVDVNGQKELYRLITTIRDEQQCGVLMVSHDLHLVMASTDTVYCINRHVCCSGHPQNVRQHPAYMRLFGGESGDLAVYTHHHNHEHDINGNILAAPENSDTQES
ncbi:Zinc import ATP-binding protein ZnuC [invertebrate metagenome]|uniref:Zinc import ATP-binding protein ZnuC n=1 Tax=invertebrate metagenome TaxID=1711999 RepID=A0A2H9T6V0_9ZZZZ